MSNLRARTGLFVAAWLLASAPNSRALQNNAGGNTSEFLRIGAGARALGMGDAFGPVAEGPEAIYWNPAGLARLNKPEFSYSRTESLNFFHHDFAAYAQPLGGRRGTLGVSYTRLSQDSLTAVSNTNVNQGSFSPSSDAISLCYAFAWPDQNGWLYDKYSRRLRNVSGATAPFDDEHEGRTGNLMMGFCAKGVRESIYTRNSMTLASDGGVLLRPIDAEPLALSFSWRNAGGRQKFLDQAEDLPMEGSLGASYDFRDESSRILPALELVMPYYGNPYGKLGVEYSHGFGETLTLAYRIGYKSLSATDLSPLSGLTVGFGALYRHRFRLDLGSQPMEPLGEVYRISLGFLW